MTAGKQGPNRAVLSETLLRGIGSRRVKVAVFTTYQFDPDFFEVNIIPLLFDRGWSPNPKVSRTLSEDAIREGIEIAVYYDRSGLTQGGGTAALDYRRFDVSRPTGVFHPKNILLLVEDIIEDEVRESLILVTTSANLTRSGWWENVESAHMIEMRQDMKSVIRDDLLGLGGLLSRLEREDRTGDPHKAIDAIRSFLVKRTESTSQKRRDGVLLPRLYVGKQSVPDFLREEMGIGGEEYCLEIISPYFEKSDEAKTLKTLVNALEPRSTRVFLPKREDGAALCGEGYYRFVVSMRGVQWGQLPEGLLRWSDKREDSRGRFVHAKVYRLFSRVEGREFILSGSVNLTGAAHSSGSAGNFETALFVETPGGEKLDWWMSPLPSGAPPLEFIDPDRQDEDKRSIHNISFRFDWTEDTLKYFWEKPQVVPARAEVLMMKVPVFEMPSLVFDRWEELHSEAAKSVRNLLRSTTFLELVVDGNDPQLILIREEGMERKPPLSASLSPEEILEYWSLLSTEQKAAFWERQILSKLPEEAVEALRGKYPQEAPSSMFDRFAGIFHAFSRVEARVALAFKEKRPKEVEYLLFGKKSDSLETLIDKIEEKEDSDPVNDYVTLLCARMLVQKIRDLDQGFADEHEHRIKLLKERLRVVDDIRARLAGDLGEDAKEFLAWFEQMFFLDVTLPEGAR